MYLNMYDKRNSYMNKKTYIFEYTHDKRDPYVRRQKSPINMYIYIRFIYDKKRLIYEQKDLYT